MNTHTSIRALLYYFEAALLYNLQSVHAGNCALKLDDVIGGGLFFYKKRPLDIINADGEVFVAVDTPAEVYNYSLDPTVKKDFEASVQYPDWLAYWSAWRARITTGITAGFIDDPKLASGILKDAAFSMYQIQGTNVRMDRWARSIF